MGRTLTYFVSDVHLGLDYRDMKGREERFVSFLRSIPTEETESLYMLGDIWDFWYEYEDVVPKGYVKVFAALTDLIESGVKVYFFRGNHDIWTYKYFSELGIQVLEHPKIVEIEGKTFLLAHGDGLGPGMIPYKMMRWVFHSPFFQFLFSLLHPYIAFRIGKGWSKSSRLAKDYEYKFSGESEPLYQYSLNVLKNRHIDYFIFGHYHSYVDMKIGRDSRFIILKDWMNSSNYLKFSGVSGITGYFPNMEK